MGEGFKMLSSTIVFPVSLILTIFFLIRLRRAKAGTKSTLLIFICMSTYTAINTGVALLTKDASLAGLLNWMITYGLFTIGLGITAVIVGIRDWNTNPKTRVLFAFGILMIVMGITFEAMYFKALLKHISGL